MSILKIPIYDTNKKLLTTFKVKYDSFLKNKIKTLKCRAHYVGDYWSIYVDFKSKNKRQRKSLHRVIWELVNGKIKNNMVIDHINNNALDNRLINLRLATKRQNSFNVRPKGKIPYKGVIFNPTRNNYRARIKVKGKEIHLGYFSCPKAAAKAYNIQAKKFFGEFAWINIL